MKILLWGGAAHLVLLGIEHEFLVQLFARAQAGDLDGDIGARLIAVEADQAGRQVHNAHGFAHVQHIDAAAFGKTPGLQHELRSFGDGHEVAHDVRVGDGDGATALDLLLKQRDNAAVAAQHVAETHGHALHIGVGGIGLDQHFADALGAAHDVGGVDSLVGRELDKALDVVLGRRSQQVFGAEDVVLDGLGRAELHERHMLVRGPHGRRPTGGRSQTLHPGGALSRMEPTSVTMWASAPYLLRSSISSS